MENLGRQFDKQVYAATDNTALRPFYNLYYYTEARRTEWLGGDTAAIFLNTTLIDNDLGAIAGGSVVTLSLPLEKKVAERTERKLKGEQRVLVLLVAIGKYDSSELPPLGYPVSDAHAFDDTLTNLQIRQHTRLVVTKIQNGTFAEVTAAINDLYREANDEDIVLFYFAGHSLDRKIILCSDGSRDNASAGWDNAALNQLIGQARKNCRAQTVFLLDTNIDDSWRPPPGDILLGGDRNGRVVESSGTPPGGVFINAILTIIDKIPDITYKDLVLWSRQLIEGRGFEQTPFYSAAPGLENRLFLRYWPRAADQEDALIAYYPGKRVWRLISEDFRGINGSRAEVIHAYDQLQQEFDNPTVSPIFLSDGEKYLDSTNPFYASADHDMLYGVRIQRSPLHTHLYGFPTDPDVVACKAMLTSQVFDFFSRWEQMALIEHPAQADDALRQGELSIRFAPGGSQRYIVSAFPPAINSARKSVQARLSWSAADAIGLLSSLAKYARYEYLTWLSEDADDEISYGKFDVEVNFFGLIAANNPGEPLHLDHKSFTFSGGKASFERLTVNFFNGYSRPIYFDLYLQTSDLAIARIGSSGNEGLMPGRIDIPFDHQRLLSRLLDGEITACFRVLLSFDPIRVDFSQPGLAATNPTLNGDRTNE
jgi:hypothetical protein